MDFDNEDILIQGNICKSITGQEDENGNYIFEVEASNENLDLQNQITLQSALLKSKDYFLTNGVISDDHLHKTRNPDGSVETHKDKIIGEPISIRTDGKSTFVKGILYAGVQAAKDYINLLKNNSTRVKASIGGIMPKIKKNADGSETVTSFMWNDLALTCSPVNWTVGSAKFAKSMGIVDFCKSLNAGSGTDAATYTDGRALQKEDIEDKTVKLQELSDAGNLAGDDEDDDLKKAKKTKNILKSCVQAYVNGDLNTKDDMETFLKSCGIDSVNASDISLEIIKQGGMRGIMRKSSFSSTIDELLKSFSRDEEDKKKKKTDSENEEENTLFDEDTPAKDDSDDDGIEKCGVKKSLDDEDSDYLDATELMKSMAEKLDVLENRNAELEKSLAEVQENMIEVTKSFGDYLKTPNTRATVVEKSMHDAPVKNAGPAKRPSNADFDIFKSAVVEAAKAGDVGLDKVQYLNSEFQKSMNGQKISGDTWSEICSVVKKYR